MARSRFANVLFIVILTTGCHHNTTSTNQQPPPSLAQHALPDIALAFTAGAGQTSRPQTVTISNTGTATLELSSIKLSDPTNYAMTSNCGSSLTAPSSCALTITFKPRAEDYSAAIIITDNDPQSPHTIRLNGTVAVGVAPAAAAPAEVPAAAPAARSATVTYTLYTFPQ